MARAGGCGRRRRAAFVRRGRHGAARDHAPGARAVLGRESSDHAAAGCEAASHQRLGEGRGAGDRRGPVQRGSRRSVRGLVPHRAHDQRWLVRARGAWLQHRRRARQARAARRVLGVAGGARRDRGVRRGSRPTRDQLRRRERQGCVLAGRSLHVGAVPKRRESRARAAAAGMARSAHGLSVGALRVSVRAVQEPKSGPAQGAARDRGHARGKRRLELLAPLPDRDPSPARLAHVHQRHRRLPAG